MLNLSCVNLDPRPIVYLVVFISKRGMPYGSIVSIFYLRFESRLVYSIEEDPSSKKAFIDGPGHYIRSFIGEGGFRPDWISLIDTSCWMPAEWEEDTYKKIYFLLLFEMKKIRL